jgi:hypothetical protein
VLSPPSLLTLATNDITAIAIAQASAITIAAAAANVRTAVVVATAGATATIVVSIVALTATIVTAIGLASAGTTHVASATAAQKLTKSLCILPSWSSISYWTISCILATTLGPRG